MTDVTRLRAQPNDLSDSAQFISFTQYVPVTTPFEAILRREFWSHVCERFVIGNTVTVMPQDHAWRAVLFVRDVGPTWARMELLSKNEFDKIEDDGKLNTEGFHVEWKNVGENYAVVRDRDNAVIGKGFKTKPEAMAAMVQHAAKAA